jgi:hypothetical protein
LLATRDVNDADRLGHDPAMRWIVGGRAVTNQAASTSQMGRFETCAMTSPRNLTALADLSGRWVDRVQTRRARTTLVLDVPWATRTVSWLGDGDGPRSSGKCPLNPLCPDGPCRAVASLVGVTRATGQIVSLPLAGTPENTDPHNPDAPVVECSASTEETFCSSPPSVATTPAAWAWGAAAGPLVRGSRELFVASTDRLGENPYENCQLFSIDSLAGGLRQLTHFDEGARVLSGCFFRAPPGCAFADVYQDPVTRWIVFYSNCHPFDPNFIGSQVFAMRPDGRRLRQLTHTAGAHWVGDEVEVEIPGPIAYSMPIR